MTYGKGCLCFASLQFFGDKYYDIKKQQMKWAQRYYIYTSK